MANIVEGPPKPNITFYGIELTNEQAKQIECKKINIWHNQEGRTLFEIRDRNDKPTGKYMVYVIFE